MPSVYSDALRRAMDTTVASGSQPCASAAICRGGEEIFRYACGLRDIQRREPIDESTIFRLYSLTKPVTAVTAMAMVERGLLDLLQPVGELLPGFRCQRVGLPGYEAPARRPVTIRDLFSMTSGLVYPGDATPAERATARVFADATRLHDEGRPLTTQALMNQIGEQPLAFHPGESWQYGLSADALGAALEVAGGKRFGDLMRELVLEPLGMKDTSFFVPPEKAGRLMRLYALGEGGLTAFTPGHLAVWDATEPPAFESGGAGLFSTLDDMLRFGRMLLGRGTLDGARVLSPASVDWLSHDHLSDAQRASANWDSLMGYGYGGLMRVLLEPARCGTLGAVGEYGWDGWTGPYLSVSPAADTVLVVMQQRTNNGFNDLTRRIRNIVYASEGGK